MNVVGLRRAHTVCIAGLRCRFLRRVQRGLALVVAQHREALAGLTARSLLAANALLAARALRADGAGLAGLAFLAACAGCTRCAGFPLGADGALLAAQSLKLRRREVGIGEGISLLSLLAFLPSGADCAGISLVALLAARTGRAGCADGSALTWNAALALFAFRTDGAGLALRAGRGNARVDKGVLRRVPLEPVPRRAVNVGHFGDCRLRACPGLEHLVHPALIRRRRLGRSRRAQRRLRHRPPRSALGNHTVHRVSELGQSIARSRGVGAAEYPDDVAVLARDARGIRHGVALPLHRQREYARAVQPRPRIRDPRPDDPLCFVLSLPAQRQIGELLHLDRSHRISYPLS